MPINLSFLLPTQHALSIHCLFQRAQNTPVGKSFSFAFSIYTVVMNISKGVGGIHTAKMANVLFLSFAIKDT